MAVLNESANAMKLPLFPFPPTDCRQQRRNPISGPLVLQYPLRVLLGTNRIPRRFIQRFFPLTWKPPPQRSLMMGRGLS
eukprot:3763602-Rhodomonas_salina.1